MIDSAHNLLSVACPSETQCTAVDDGGREMTFNPASPGSPAPDAIDGAYPTLSVACPSVAQCTAVDGGGGEVTFNPTSPGTAGGSPASGGAGARAGGISLSVSHGSLSGVGAGRPRLSFTLTAAASSPPLKTITIALPGGLRFSSSKRNLAKGIIVSAHGRRLKFTATVRHASLILTLKLPASTEQVTISSPALAAGRRLAKEVRERKVKVLSILVSATDTAHAAGAITLRLRPR